MSLKAFPLLSVAPIIIVTANGIGALHQDHLLIDQVATTIVRSRTIPYQHHQTLVIYPREEALTITIDFASLPTCAANACVTQGSWATPLPCSTIPSPCPSSTSSDCLTFDQSCFCTLAAPLKCAFHPCSWSDWMLMENWFNKTCPKINPSIDYGFKTNSSENLTVPKCAKNCIHQQVISYGCTSESLNCFCSHLSLFGCRATCNGAENSTIASWLAVTCQLSGDSAIDIVADDQLGNSEAKAGGPSPPQRPKPLDWYELLGIIVFSTTTGVVMLIAFVKDFLHKYRSARI